jgi:micrococcal nuclease
MFAEMVARRHAFFALLRGGEVAFNTLIIWRHCFACCLLLLLSISAFGAELRGIVVRVTDGDTIVIQSGEEQYKIRISGIDAPEIRQAFGREARAALAGQVEDKAVVIVWEKKDRYGRLLGTVLLGSVNVNLEQMRGGFA